ncbi:MAG: bifunctional proline dehydrogenase/L-glutamate gamma-semialdehyde dehydrogenase [Candidatus Hydrogenedentes bacterium]|nr:bifunctional proline dehydrogenase/L-glutamate gamma-semialdehyde dehydrogenase [Candidatus Hydrogenedentota bacterium]
MALSKRSPVADAKDPVFEYGLSMWRCVEREHANDDGFDWLDAALDWVMREDRRRRALLQLVDVLPSLKDDDQLADHVEAYLTSDDAALPAILRGPVKVAVSKPFRHALAAVVQAQVSHIARRFIVCSTPEEAVSVLRGLWNDGFAFSADLLGERTLTDREANAVAARYLHLIELLSEATQTWPARPLLERDALGPLPRANVSLKLSALDPSQNPADPEGSASRLAALLLPILLRAKQCNVFVNFDMEQYALHEIAHRAFETCALHDELRSWRHLGIVVQAYCKEAGAYAERLVSLAARRNAPVTVRLVKGAYWDYETAVARQEGRPSPLFADKESTDANFEQITRYLLDHAGSVHAAFASHNVRSLTNAVLCASERNIGNDQYEVQMLYGMAPAEQRALRNTRHRVRLYSPVGELIPGMAYLVRRLLENSSNDGFLRLAFREGADMDQLLKRPRLHLVPNRAGGRRKPRDITTFENCGLIDFADENARARLAESVSLMPVTFPRKVPVVVNGNTNTTDSGLEHSNPSDTTMLISIVSQATPSDIDEAIASAVEGGLEWNSWPIEERALCLESLADTLEDTRCELAALEVYEAGKTLQEADADVVEAIDFCRYYARQARVELAPETADAPPGESNQWLWEGRGPTAVIAPWNFPIGILCGMASAALVAGNSVLLKPAEQSSACAHALFRAMQTVGIPRGVVHFLPGRGEDVGRRLVEHPDIAVVAFTGSMEVGRGILETAARVAPSQTMLKSVICELGGKNAIVVDEDADLDDAVAGVLASAFGYAGQKCSAASRAILVGGIAQPFVDRLIGAAQRLRVCPASDPGCDVPPVIDAVAYTRLMSVIGDPGAGAELLHTGLWTQGGYYVPPTIFRVTDPEHMLMQRELFGPVLTVYEASTFAHAIEIALRTPYALTGGVYSRNPRHIAEARQRFRTGNLYINRACTGARVGRQPFGGLGLSGCGAKAGGPGYLTHFAVQRCVTENTMRKGFTPEL